VFPRAVAHDTTSSDAWVAMFVLTGPLSTRPMLRPKALPVAVARAQTDAPRGTLDGAELVVYANCLAIAALLLVAAGRWARRTG
jgi:hypothetical protein